MTTNHHALSMQASGLLSGWQGGQQREPVIQKNCSAQCSHLTCVVDVFVFVYVYGRDESW